ncbi:MAG: heavy-metal-associated domain-containing protein [Alistipes sp.]|nr:heavy-metal-associated domain-containing protein [Alistipes sp.]
MKKMAMLCLMLAMGMGMTMAAKPAADKTTVTTVFKTDIHCDHCANKIMNNVPSLGKGIKDVEVDIATKEVKVTYDATKNTDANIVKGFASLKVKAEPKPAAGK